MTHEGEIWAILVGVSHSLSDYRHEANVPHAYNILLRRRVTQGPHYEQEGKRSSREENMGAANKWYFKQRAHLDASIYKILLFLFGTVNAPAILDSDSTEMRSPSLDDCYSQANDLFEASCGELGDYGLHNGHNMMLRKICEAGASVVQIEQACQAVCPAK